MYDDIKLKIEYLPIDSLKPYDRNNKKHEEFDISQIAKSIEENGMCDPIGIKGDTIVEGHGRVEALKKLGRTEAPCIRLDHLTEEEARKYRILHNKTAELAEYDFTSLEIELEDLDFSEYDFDFENGGEKRKKEKIEGEVPFTEVLDEENNYIVLKFDNTVDWLQLESLFDLETVKAYSSRTDGKVTKNMTRAGVGRVVNGANFLNKLGVELWK